MNALRPDGSVRLWLIAALAALFWGTEYWQRDLWEPDEARYAYVAREMRQDGHWLVPHRSGEYYAHKPPLIFWLNNAFATFNGGEINRLTTRLPTLLGTILSLWTTGRIAAILFGGTAGWMAPMVLAVSALFWNVNGTGQIDGLLCGLQMLAFWLLFSASIEPRRQTGLRLASAGLSMGLAVLAKGPVGLLVPLGAWISFCLFSGRRRLLLRPEMLWVPALALLPVAWWLASVLYFEAAPDGFLDELFFKQNIGRVAGRFAEGHRKPAWYFLACFLQDFLPWTPLLPVATVALCRHDDCRTARHGVTAWLVFVILFFTLSATKRNLYTLMAYPAAAMLMAAGWDRIAAAPGRLRRVAQHAVAGMVLAAGTAMILAEPTVRGMGADVPVRLWVLIPGGLALLASGGMLLRHAGGTSPQRWFLTLWIGTAFTLWMTSILLYPVLNPVKAPYALVAAARAHLPEGQELLLYKMHGEIQAFYCHARGKVFFCRDALEGMIRMQRQGLVVLSRRDWNEISNIPAIAEGIRGDYRMGSKQLVWVAFKDNSQRPDRLATSQR